MRHSLRVFFGVMLVFPFGLIAGTNTGMGHVDGLRLSVEKRGENLLVLIENHTEHDVKINKTFSMDPLIGSIHFAVTSGGDVKAMIAQINPVPLSEDSYIDLQPGGVYGHLFDISHFDKMFNLKNACYKVQSYYKDEASSEFHSFGGKIVSNQISVCGETRN